MRILPVALLALSACIAVERPAPRPAYAPAAATPSPPASAPAPRPAITREEAVRRAFDFARDRGLEVDRVHEAKLDDRGRWRVDLRGREDQGGQGDRARLLIDARDGRLLKGRFRESDPDLED